MAYKNIYAKRRVLWFLSQFLTPGKIAVAGFVIMDFIVLYSVFSVFSGGETGLIILTAALIGSIGLDTPMYFAAKVIKDFQQGLCSMKMMIIVVMLGVLAFGGIGVQYFKFNLETGGIVYQANAKHSSNMEVTDIYTPEAEPEPPAAADSANNRPGVRTYTIFIGMLPFLTSIVSFILSMTTYHPLEERIRKLQYMRDMKRRELCMIETDLAGEPTEKELRERLTKKINDEFIAFVFSVLKQEFNRKIAVRTAFMKYCSPNDLTYIADESADMFSSDLLTEFVHLYDAQLPGEVKALLPR